MKVLLENLLRFEDGGFTVSTDDVKAIVDWQKDPHSNQEIQYRPARVLLLDFTGVPCVVDLAAMRDALATLGGDTSTLKPLVPVHLAKIVRTSCRARECQYDSNTVSPVSLKHKTQP